MHLGRMTNHGQRTLISRVLSYIHDLDVNLLNFNIRTLKGENVIDVSLIQVPSQWALMIVTMSFSHIKVMAEWYLTMY